MACKKNKTKTGCGCGEKFITTPCSCNKRECDEDVCPEMFDTKCMLYLGQDMYSGNFSVDKGENMTDILQRLLVYLNDTSVDASLIPVGLRVKNITEDSAKVIYNKCSDTDTSIMYKGVDDVEWEESTCEGSTLLINLQSNKEYLVKIVDKVNDIESVTVKFKTL